MLIAANAADQTTSVYGNGGLTLGTANGNIVIEANGDANTTGTVAITAYKSIAMVSNNGDTSIVAINGNAAVNGDNLIFDVTQNNGTITFKLPSIYAELNELVFQNKGDSGGITITGLAAPVSNGDAANKQYVDSLVVGLNFKQSCRLNSAPGNTPFGAVAAEYSSAMNTIALINPGTDIRIDSITIVNGDRILVTQASVSLMSRSGQGASVAYLPEAAGIYEVTDASGILTRTSDCDTTLEISSAYTYVGFGTSAGNSYVQTYSVATFDTDPQNWIVFSAVGAANLTSHIGPTMFGNDTTNDTTGIVTMASVKKAASTGPQYVQNFGAGGLILESDIISCDASDAVTLFGPALYMTSPNATGLGRKGTIRLLSASTGNGLLPYVSPTSYLSFQRFGVAPNVTITDCKQTGLISLSNSISGGYTNAHVGDEIMFSGTNSSNSSWVGAALDPTVTYFISDITASNGITVSTTTDGSVFTLTTDGQVPNAQIYLWTEMSKIG